MEEITRGRFPYEVGLVGCLIVVTALSTNSLVFSPELHQVNQHRYTTSSVLAEHGKNEAKVVKVWYVVLCVYSYQSSWLTRHTGCLKRVD